MGESFLRTWQDADAPVLLPSKGTAVNWLKKVLAEGYGSTPGLGWEVVFEQTDKIVLRNQGTRTFVRFDHSLYDHQVFITAYESMSDVDTGLFRCPNSDAESAPFQLFLANSGTSTANVVPWRVLGDSKGVWFLIGAEYASQGGNNSFACGAFKFSYVGDYIPYDIYNTQYNFVLAQDDNADHPYDGLWNVDGLNTIHDHYHVMRNPDRITGSIMVGLSSGSGYEQTALGYTPDICTHESDVQHTSIPELHVQGKLLGRLPGLKNSLSQRGYKGDSFSTYTDVETRKPEITFDFGDYKEHFWRYPQDNSGYLCYIVLTEGKGFRNAV